MDPPNIKVVLEFTIPILVKVAQQFRNVWTIAMKRMPNFASI